MKAIHTAMAGLALIVGLFGVGTANAGVTIAGTRVIYNGSAKEQTVQLTNNDATRPALVQSWVDDGRSDVDPATLRVPFSISPPLARIAPSSGQTLRLRYNPNLGQPLPEDRESVLYLNVLEIPPEPDKQLQGQNLLQLAVRTRIKLFYRPQGLAGKSGEAASALSWRVERGDGQQWIEIKNPSAYHVTLSAVEADGHAVREGGMVSPHSSLRLPLEGAAPVAAGGRIAFKWINDQGAQVSGSAALGP